MKAFSCSVFKAFSLGKKRNASACEDDIIFNKKWAFPLIKLKCFSANANGIFFFFFYSVDTEIVVFKVTMEYKNQYVCKVHVHSILLANMKSIFTISTGNIFINNLYHIKICMDQKYQKHIWKLCASENDVMFTLKCIFYR